MTRPSQQINHEIQRIYQRLKRDFADFHSAVILVAYHPLQAHRLYSVQDTLAHDASIVKTMDFVPQNTVFIMARSVTQKPDSDLKVTDLAWIQDREIVTRPEYAAYTAKVEMVIR